MELQTRSHEGVELAAYDQSQTRTALHYRCILAEVPIL